MSVAARFVIGEAPAKDLPFTTLVFYGEHEGQLAMALVKAEKEEGRRAKSFDAATFIPGDAEQCHRIVIMPGVTEHHATKVLGTFAGVDVDDRRMITVEDPALSDINQAGETIATTEARTGVTVAEIGAPLPFDETALRRMPTAKLRDFATGRGIDIRSLRDRTEIMAAIAAASQREPPT
jgi:hypothetical protein